MAEIKVALEELEEETESGASTSGGAARKRGGHWRWMALGGAVLAGCAAAVLLLPRWRETQTPMREVPLTSYPGYQGQPALSPDGGQFAFVWDGGQEHTRPQLYVSLVGRAHPGSEYTGAALSSSVVAGWTTLL